MTRIWPTLALLCLSACRAVPLRPIWEAQDRREPSSAVLLKAAGSRDRRAREHAVLAMARIQSPAYAGPLIERLSDRSGALRERAAWALGQLALAETPAGVPEPAALAEARELSARALRPRLSARRPGLRAAAYEALGKAGSSEDEPRLSRGLRDPDPLVREQAAYALFRLRFLKRVPQFSSGTVRALRVAMNDPVDEVRRAAVYPFSRFAEPRAADAVAVACGEDNEMHTRLFGCRALGLIKDASLWEELVIRLKDPEPLLRAEAVRTLGLYGRADYILEQLYADPSPHVRAAVAEALAASGDAKTAYRLDAIEEDGSAMVRAAVLGASVKLRPKRAAALLEQGRRDPHWWVRSRAFLASAQLPEARAALPAGLEDPDLRVASAALEALGALDVPESAAALEATLSDPAAPLEMLGTAAEAAGQKGLPRFLPLLRRAAGFEAARKHPELADGLAQAYRLVASSHPALAAEPWPAPAPPPAALSAHLGRVPPPTILVVETEKGRVELELFAEDAPVHASAILETALRGAYDGTVWHRIVTNFVVQGGDPRGTGWGDAGYSLRDEINRRRFERGVLGMPKAGKDTGGGQLFVTLVPTPHLDGRYTAFGRVLSGLDVIDRLEPGDKIARVFVK